LGNCPDQKKKEAEPLQVICHEVTIFLEKPCEEVRAKVQDFIEVMRDNIARWQHGPRGK
jgi:hypothetical protein